MCTGNYRVRFKNIIIYGSRRRVRVCHKYQKICGGT